MSPGRPGFPGMGYRQGDGSLIRIGSHVSTGYSHRRPANSVAFSDRLAETQDVRGSCRDAQPRHYQGCGLRSQVAPPEPRSAPAESHGPGNFQAVSAGSAAARNGAATRLQRRLSLFRSQRHHRIYAPTASQLDGRHCLSTTMMLSSSFGQVRLKLSRTLPERFLNKTVHR